MGLKLGDVVERDKLKYIIIFDSVCLKYKLVDAKTFRTEYQYEELFMIKADGYKKIGRVWTYKKDDGGD